MSQAAVRPCPSCGAPNRARALFCGACGQRLQAEARPAPRDTATRPMGDRRIRGWLASFDFDDNGEGFVIRQGDNVIGRDPRACAVLLMADPAVSRQHCVLRATEAGAFLLDRGSHNGTRLNGQRLDESPHEVKDGDLIGVCAYTLIVKLLP